ncbi:MAG TPA: SDR family NAD(P)-dependent oxidoreductase [Rhizomicrobium sp.]|nr:SDR family NAD(P)-dependent oxidoreductase [Rhizomicrobium sp.]
MSSTLSGRVALVTGASRGIGYAAAKALAAEGAHVIAVARTAGALEDLDDEIKKAGNPGATLVPLDLRDFDALDRLGASIHQRWGKLDAFFGNAGVLGVLTPLSHLEPKVWQEAIDVNVTANWRLIRSFDPLLRKSDAGRALFVTTGVAREHRPYWGSYAVTKAALESLVLTYAAECESTTVRVNLLSPGPLRTRMRMRAMPGEDPETLQPPDVVAPMIVHMLSPSFTKNGELARFTRTGS